MLDVPSREDLIKLSNERGEFHVSLYMPLIKGGVESQQNSTRLKNLIREAEKKLQALKGGSSANNGQFQQAQALAEDVGFFQHPGEGFAMFIAPNGDVKHFNVPLSFAEDVHVNSRYHVKPLMQLHVSNGRFFVLAVSQKNLRLLEGNRFYLREIPLPKNTPTSREEAMKYEDWERAHHLSPGSQGRRAGGTMQFAGHGVDASDKEMAKREMLQFMQMVNKGISSMLGKETAPLIIAGLEYMHPIAREAINYPHLQSNGVVRNVDDLRPEELQALAWAVAEPLFHKAQDAAVERFNEFKTKGLASSNIAEVIPAAADGRVETLMVPVGQHCWGTFDETNQKVRVQQDEKSAKGEDLIDLAAIQAMRNGAAVYAVRDEEMPESASVAAIFRY
jgi:hypothetical protein